MSHTRRQFGPSAGTGGILALAGLLMLVGCDRHSEDQARAMMGGWFDLGETLYFESQRGCTAAVFRVKSNDVKSRVPLFDSAEAIAAGGQQNEAFALSVRGKTADVLFIDLMNADRPIGVAIQTIGLGARDCMSDQARNTFFAALNADPSTVVFSWSKETFAVLDPVRGIAMMTSGDL